MRIKRIHELSLVNYIKSHKDFVSEKSIQYGVQYTVGGVFLNFHYSEKTPDTFSLTIQNAEADPEISKLIEGYAAGIAEKA